MSFAKRLIELREQQWDVATQIALDARALESCEFHGEVYDPLGGDEVMEHAYRLGNYRFSAGRLNRIFDDRREMTDTIKAVVQNAAMDCYSCAKWRED